MLSDFTAILFLSCLLYLSWLQNKELLHASFSPEAPLISCWSIQAEKQETEVARTGVPSTQSLKPMELPGPCPPQLQPDSPGHHKTDEVWSMWWKWWTQAAWPRVQESRKAAYTASCPPQLLSFRRLPWVSSQPSLWWQKLVILCFPTAASHIFQENRVKFSLVSPR